MVLVLGFVTARSRIFSHRTTAHDPHKIDVVGRTERPLPRRRPDRGDAVRDRDVSGGEGGEVSIRHPRQLGQHQQAAVAAAEHARGPAVRGQPAERRLHRIPIPFRGLEGFAGGPAERGPHRHRLPRPLVSGGGVVVVDGGDPPPPGGRRRRARMTGTRRPCPDLAGSAGRSVTAQWSVNSAQSDA